MPVNREVDAGLSFPSMVTVTVQFVLLAVGLPVVYLMSKVLKIYPKPTTIANPRREATLAFLIIMAETLVVSAWRVLTHTIVIPTFQLDKRPPFSVDAVDVLWRLVLTNMALLPILVAMKRTGQNPKSIGISRKDAGRMLALGFVLSAILFMVQGLVASSAGGGFTGFSPSLAYGIIFFAIVGLGEEIVWRGYIQTRLIATGGTIKGLLATSLLFAVLWHFPRSYYEYSGVVLEAFVAALLRFPAGLLFGYIMSRSQNIIPSSIFHLFWNWNIYFWRFPAS